MSYLFAGSEEQKEWFEKNDAGGWDNPPAPERVATLHVEGGTIVAAVMIGRETIATYAYASLEEADRAISAFYKEATRPGGRNISIKYDFGGAEENARRQEERNQKFYDARRQFFWHAAECGVPAR